MAYVNVDGCTSGSAFDGEASPALKKVIIESLKSTPFSTKNNQYSDDNYSRRQYGDNDEDDDNESMDSEYTYYEHWRKLVKVM